MGKRKYTPRKIGTCLDCKKEKRLVTTTACWKCYNLLHRPRIKCAGGCGSTDRTSSGKNADGQPVCAPCYAKLGLWPKTKCDNCGALDRPRHSTTADGKVVCLNCYGKLNMRPKITCANCQSEKFPQHGKLADGRGVCEGCYTKLDLRPKRLCTNCGATDRPQHGATAEGKAVCELCYNNLGLRPTMDCENCGGKDQQRGGTTAEGKAVCKKCYHKLGLQLRVLNVDRMIVRAAVRIKTEKLCVSTATAGWVCDRTPNVRDVVQRTVHEKEATKTARHCAQIATSPIRAQKTAVNTWAAVHRRLLIMLAHTDRGGASH